ncbi:MAG: aspartate aminotransferase [Rhodospirillales bacterium CG15_BIG_FIL_POST_REV_8_21_14_020_66_15]|nr:MAG: aspartate aminotransferase [Rhodospirillales bacterium CG15_BIG_FIL_POST_REV_8_21_14_020_66_15]
MLNPRYDDLPVYPFDRLRALLDPHAPAPGLEPISLAVGDPTFDPPPAIAQTMADKADLWGRYPATDGTPGFRAAAAGFLERRYGLGPGVLDPERNVLPVVGTREGLAMVANLVVPPEKSGARPLVVLPNPCFHTYVGAAVFSGAERRPLPATADTGFMPDLTRMTEAEWARTALVYLCSPGNPQGGVAPMSLLMDLILLARRHDFVLVADECYAEIYDAAPPPGALEACAALDGDFTNVLVFHSLSKRSSAPGLRSGFVAGDAELIRRYRMLRNYLGAQMPHPALHASARLWADDSDAFRYRAAYRDLVNTAQEILGERFGFRRPAGGFFLWLDVGDGEEAALTLWKKAAIRVLPGAYMSAPLGDGTTPGDAFIRVALVHDRKTIETALRRLVKVL